MSILREDPWLRRAAIFCGVIFGGFLLWATIAPLAEGVTAYGKVSADMDRQIVQHLEGGIVDEILVREGDTVKAGQQLIVLRDVSAMSGRTQVAIDYADIRATIARLAALSAQENALDLSSFDFGNIEDETKMEIMRRQQDLFAQQKRKLAADVSVLSARRNGMEEQVENSETEIASNQRALEIIQRDLADKRGLLKEKLIASAEVTALERDEASLSAELGRLNTAKAAGKAEVEELTQQISQIEADFAEEVARNMVDARSKRSEFAQKLLAMEDVVDRSVITAPVSGTILNLTMNTTGGVVRAGEPIMEIIPNHDALIATVQVRPSDIENVYGGLPVRTRLSGLASWRTPSLQGQVSQVSADLKTSQSGDYSYYEARIRMDAEELKRVGAEVIPGMPIEAFIQSGHTRTLLDYLFEPLNSTLRRAARS